MVKFEIYKGKSEEFRWRLFNNEQVVAYSSEGYTTKVEAMNDISLVKENASSVTVEDRTGPGVLIISGNHKIEGGLL